MPSMMWSPDSIQLWTSVTRSPTKISLGQRSSFLASKKLHCWLQTEVVPDLLSTGLYAEMTLRELSCFPQYLVQVHLPRPSLSELLVDLTAELRELVEPFRVTPVPLELVADLVYFAATSRTDVKTVSSLSPMYNLNVKGNFKPLSKGTINLVV
jgi:hypothetical protein